VWVIRQEWIMSRGIKLSPKHGVNPSISVCFWCGKQKNAIVLLGKLKGDAKAPKEAVFDYEPCDECREGMSRGVSIIEAVQTREESKTGLPAMINGVYPTGRMVVMNTEAFNRYFQKDSKSGDKICMLPEDFEKLFGGLLKESDHDEE
jgi:hypothetical protein